MSADDQSDAVPVVVENPWSGLRRFTTARIALGRSGTSLPTAPHLEFQLAHARARKAVHQDLDTAKLAADLAAIGQPALCLKSEVGGHAEYLQRPDKGRRLDAASRSALASRWPDCPDCLGEKPAPPYDAVFVICDGLSALAVQQSAVPLLVAVWSSLAAAGWRVGPPVIVTGARVAIGDEVARGLPAKLVVVLIGERPGLSSPESMGIYLTLLPTRQSAGGPATGITDEARNCISNVRRDGLSTTEAAHKLIYLMTEARRRGLSGVQLKDDAPLLSPSVANATAGAHGGRLFLLTDE
jgi:ethanolamine ammonia-lyase small subunit